MCVAEPKQKPKSPFLPQKEMRRGEESQRFFNTYLFCLLLFEQVSEGWHQAFENQGVLQQFLSILSVPGKASAA